MNKSYLTAIYRNKPSKPTQWLFKHNKIIGKCLDYGCGRGFDANFYNLEQYDIHYQPKIPRGKFNTIICNYVLNVVPEEKEQKKIMRAVGEKLAAGGIAYFSVRNDRKNLTGWRKNGTWQGLVKLDLPIEYRCSSFIIYRLEK